MNSYYTRLASTVGNSAGHQCPTRDEAQARKLEEEPRLEKDILFPLLC